MALPIQLGELLFHEGLVTIPELEEAYRRVQRDGGRLVDALLDLGLVRDGEIATMLSRWYGFPAVDVSRLRLDPSVLALVPRELAIDHGVLPIARRGATLRVVMIDPTDDFTLHRLMFKVPYYVRLMVAPENEIREAIRKYYGESSGARSVAREDNASRRPASEEELELARKLCDEILAAALRPGAREIHIAPVDGELEVRFFEEADVLRQQMKLPLGLRDQLIQRVKTLADLDVRQRWRPQRGRMSVASNVDGREVVLRVFTYPTRFGEKVVARLLA